MTEMLIAVRDGFLEDDGELVEIVAGKTRISPELLKRPEYFDFFERGVSARGTDATRCIARGIAPDGRMVAVDLP